MSRIVIRGEFPFRPGMAEQGKAAALALRERVLREHEGVLVYEFAVDESNETLAITEAYVDEPALMDHIDASDFTPLFSALDFAAGSIQLLGNPSPALVERLEAFGSMQFFSTLHPPGHAASESPAPGAEMTPPLFQLGYVTNDFDRALKCFAQTHGVGHFLESRQLAYPTGPGREAVCNVAFAFAGGLQIELIHPVDGDVGIYLDHLPESGFAVRLHHVCHRYDTIEALEGAMRRHRSLDRTVPVDAALPGLARYFYVDVRAELGHYLEGVVLDAEADEWLASIPRF